MASYLSRLLSSAIMESKNSCLSGCGEHGACVDGACICEVKFSGGSCADPNLSYFIGFSIVFYLISIVSTVQLVLCVRSEFLKQVKPSWSKACRLTIQKSLYICMIVATGTRGLYFSVQEYLPKQWSNNLFSAYYPFIISGFSVIICFWAEAVHLVGLPLEKPRFLSKSFIGFIIFNVIVYIVLLAQVVATEVSDSQTKSLLYPIFSGVFAALMLLVLIFFLIYGVEIFCKLRGAFVTDQTKVDATQLVLSRFGLVAQGAFQLLTAIFLMGDVMGRMWKDSLPIFSRNVFDVVFRVFELGVALWFPCVLWNWSHPDQLWILNPKKLLLKQAQHDEPCEDERKVLLHGSRATFYKSLDRENMNASEPCYTCWICYDNERDDAGSLIFPCQCKGDVAAVHHECLRTWLLETSTNSSEENFRCKVCKEPYTLETGKPWLPSGLKIRDWFQTLLLIPLMLGCPVGVYVFCRMDVDTPWKICMIGINILLEYVCLRLLGFSLLGAYRRAKVMTFTIIGRDIDKTPQKSIDSAELEGSTTVRISAESSIETVAQVEVPKC